MLSKEWRIGGPPLDRNVKKDYQAALFATSLLSTDRVSRMQQDMNPTLFHHSVLVLLVMGWALADVFVPVVQATDKPQGIPREAVRFDAGSIETATWFAAGDSLYTEVTTGAEDASLKLPRLANVVKSICWQSAPETKISLQPEPDHWVIRHGKPPIESGDVLVVSFDAPPAVFDGSTVIRAATDGLLLLPAKLATTAGDNLRYEPQPHKNTVGYWSNVKATAEWKFLTPRKGLYEIDILQGCGSGHGGSMVEVQIGEEARTFIVEETGHFQNFIWRTVGTVEVPSNVNVTLKLVPKSKPGGAVMDIRAVRLSPPGTTRSFESELAAPDALPRKQ